MAKSDRKEKKPADSGVRQHVLYGVVSVLLIALGVFVMIKPEVGVAAVCGVIGALALIFGIVKVTVYFMTEVKGVGVGSDLTVGAVCVIIGGILLIKPTGIVDLIQVIVGIYLLADGAAKLQSAVDAKRLHISGWYVPLIFTVVCIVLGVIMILRVGAQVVMVLVGACLAVDGLTNLCIVIFYLIGRKKLSRMDKDGDGMPDIIDATDAQETAETPAE